MLVTYRCSPSIHVKRQSTWRTGHDEDGDDDDEGVGRREEEEEGGGR